MVSTIGNKLAELGYEVIINHKPEIGRSNVFRIYLTLEGNNVLLFSNSNRDENGTAFISSNPSTKTKEIIELILSLV